MPGRNKATQTSSQGRRLGNYLSADIGGSDSGFKISTVL